MKAKSIKTSLLIILVCLLLSASASYLYTQRIVSQDKKLLKEKIDNILDDKSAVRDGVKSPIFGGEMDSTDMNFSKFVGGFFIKELKKDDKGYLETHISPQELKYKINRRTYFYGYYTIRPGIEECLESAFFYLLKGSEQTTGLNPNFTPGKYSELSDFPDKYQSEFHSLVKDDDKFNANYPAVSTKEWSVEYTEYKTYYEIKASTDLVMRLHIRNLIYFLFGGILLAIILLIIVRRNSGKTRSNTVIFDKKWKNTNNNSILLFTKSLLGKAKVKLIENDKAKLGKAVFSDKGLTLTLIFSDAEYYYKISQLSSERMELTNLVTSDVIVFEVLGSTASQITDKES